MHYYSRFSRKFQESIKIHICVLVCLFIAPKKKRKKKRSPYGVTLNEALHKIVFECSLFDDCMKMWSAFSETCLLFALFYSNWYFPFRLILVRIFLELIVGWFFSIFNSGRPPFLGTLNINSLPHSSSFSYPFHKAIWLAGLC